MLTQIVLLNSKTYAKARIRFDDCDSIQLIGANNIGKSTLIYTLNFLFVVDGAKMTFSGNRRGDKETIHHYFPSHTKSYVIFEVFKQEHYCILVKRNVESELEYYRIDHPYDENFFFEIENGLPRLLMFEEVLTRLITKGITYYPYKNKTEVFNHVYQRGRNNNGVVWLEDTVKTDGISNNFSKIYRYLINTKLITNKTLKEALVIADNRENEGVNFSQKNKKDITDLLKINNEIKAIKSIKEDFYIFREAVNRYNASSRIIGELLYAYNKAYETAIPNLEGSFRIIDQEIADYYHRINEVLKPKEQDINRKIGEISADIKNKADLLNDRNRELKEINSFEGLDFLKQSLENLNKQRKEHESRISTIEFKKLTTPQLEKKLADLNKNIARIENQVKHFDEQLIHNIASKQEDKKILNYILSTEFSSQSSDLIVKKISKTGKTVKLFDGEINLPEKFEVKELPSVDELKEELKALKNDKKETEQLLATVTDLEKTKTEIQKIEAEIELTKEKIKKIGAKPAIEKSVFQLDGVLKKLYSEKTEFEKQIEDISIEMATIAKGLDDKKDKRQATEQRIKLLKEHKIELEYIGIEPVAFESTESLDQLYNKLKLYNNERETLKDNKLRLYDKLKIILNNTMADETEFIKYVEEEIACLNDKEKSIDALLQSISSQFANPAYSLLKRYEDFQSFVYNRFNPKLSKIKISDIESLQIQLVDNKRTVEELKKIHSIQDIQGQMTFDFNQSENLRLLEHYLDTGKKINFADLFEIELSLIKNGEEKKVDLAGQVESDGTDRMIRLVIIMSIINRLAVNDVNNRIALFIDEVATIDRNNRPELVKFCKEHFFIPIFAAPDPMPDFNKYYFLFQNKSGKIMINDTNVVWQTKKEEEKTKTNKLKTAKK